ncbi:MAG: Glutaredoxin [Ramalina farinacea]|uniref:Glutaredoxin n=1 Tax=Ramalina farinacea TaxID=258253 RepID=A0AA43QMC5_9LECA|nr:Glutaredoxin [Ramalina farinacea]
MSAAKTKAEGIINDNAVGAKTLYHTFISDPWLTHVLLQPAVFSKSWCPYCKASKTLLSEMGAKFYTLELDQVDDGSAIQSALAEMTNQTSVPNIFIGQKHIGGNSDLQAQKGDLPKMLKDAGAL